MFLNNLLLAIFTQEFRWLLIRLSNNLKQIHLFVQGVNFVRLHVIQFTRYSRSP